MLGIAVAESDAHTAKTHERKLGGELKNFCNCGGFFYVFLDQNFFIL